MQGSLLRLRKLLYLVRGQLVGTVTSVATREPVAALTFDDGPDPEYTPRLLDILKRHHARGTFFMLGKHAHQHPNLVQRIAREGHAIGNHSWDHPSFPLIDSQERRRQIRECAKAIAPYGRRLFRPPYGEQSKASHFDMLMLGYEVVGWNLDVGDWCETDAYKMADQLVKRLQPGSIILMHDALYRNEQHDLEPALNHASHADREPMLAAISMFLEQTSPRYRFVTLPELFRFGQRQRRNWYRTTTAPAPAS